MLRRLLPLAALGLAACRAVAGLDKDFELDEPPTPGIDAGQDGVAPTGTDGSTEPSTDAGADAALPFACPEPLPAGMKFCTTFEPPASFADWTREEHIGGAPAIAAGVGFGGSYGLRAVMAAPTSASAKTVWWNKIAAAFPADGTTYTLSFRFLVNGMQTQYAALGVFQIGDTNGEIEHGLAVYLDASKCSSGAPCLEENDQSGRAHAPANSVKLEKKRWYTGTVIVAHTSAGFLGKVLVDGTVIKERATGAFPTATPTQIVEIGIGSFYSSGAGTNDVQLDDVVVTVSSQQ